MKEIVLVKYGEMALKGLNKKTFEDMLTKNIKRRIKSLGSFVCTSAQSTLYIDPQDDSIDCHIEDTLKGGCRLAGREAVTGLCAAAPGIVGQLERLGTVFTRDAAASRTY